MVPSTMQDSTTRPPGTSDSLLRTADTKKIQRPRASSAGKARPDNVDVIARLMSTFNFQQFGFKGNIGGECIHGPFITLQQLLLQIDPSVCFDVELSRTQKTKQCLMTVFYDADTLHRIPDALRGSRFQHGHVHYGAKPLPRHNPRSCVQVWREQANLLFLLQSGALHSPCHKAANISGVVSYRIWVYPDTGHLSHIFPRSCEIRQKMESGGGGGTLTATRSIPNVSWSGKELRADLCLMGRPQ